MRNETLDYEVVTLEYNGDMAEHEQDYRTTAKVGSMFTTNKLTKYACGNFATVVKSQLPPASATAAGSLD